MASPLREGSPDSPDTDSGPAIPSAPPQLTLTLPDDHPHSFLADPWDFHSIPVLSRPFPSFSRPNPNARTFRVPLRFTPSSAGGPVRQNTTDTDIMTDPSRHPLERPHSDGPSLRRRRFYPPRTLDALLSPDDTEVEDRFFVPTYLNKSVYMQRLASANQANVRAKQAKRPNNGINNSSADVVVNTSTQSLPPGSHRGLSHTVIERSPSRDDQDGLTPLPSKWNKDDMWPGIDIEGGVGLKYTAPKGQHDRDHEASAARANHHMPPQCGIYYYETTILESRKDDTTIAIGFSTKTATLSRHIGWEPESWGYHGDDGKCFTAQNVGRSYSGPYNKGDVIGCGVNFKDNNAFFTRNGIFLGTAFHDVVRGKLFPAISLRRQGEKVKTNFGQEPFVFDIDHMIQEHRDKIQEDINSANTSQLEPGVSETDLIQALVLQFLQRDGYVDTARAFAEEMRDQKKSLDVDPDAKIGGVDMKDDEDATNRQRIRSAILEGDIDKALKYTQAFYPKVLPNHERVHFKLRCRKFIEMTRKAAEMKMANEPSVKSNWLASDSSSQKMDLDQSVSDLDSKQNLALMDLEQEILMYGQSLQLDYGNDSRTEFSSGLQEIWSLMAYDDPLKEPHLRHLLDQQGRVVVAEDLNMAILATLGKASRAALEKIYGQTTVLLDELRRNGGEGAFISIDDAVDDIPDRDRA